MHLSHNLASLHALCTATSKPLVVGPDHLQHSLPCCLQVGQVILTLPNAFSTTGLAAGVFFQLTFATVALWTLFLMATLYQEFRRRKAAWRRDLHHGIIMVTCALCSALLCSAPLCSALIARHLSPKTNPCLQTRNPSLFTLRSLCYSPHPMLWALHPLLSDLCTLSGRGVRQSSRAGLGCRGLVKWG